MRIVQIVGSMHNLSAGPSYSIARLADELYRAGHDVTVLTPGQQPGEWPYRVPLAFSTGWLDNHLGVSAQFMREVRRRARLGGILHGHGIWRFANNVFPVVLDRNAPVKIVCSPRGSMSAWSMGYKGLVKKPFWRLVQKPALQRCNCFHVTSKEEYENVRRLELRAPVAVIPNGVDMPDIDPGAPRRRQVVFLGRINPVKGIDMLIHAWSVLCRQFPDWELVIAGPLADDYARDMQRLAAGVCGGVNVRFAGELRGEQKTALLSGASLFVLPSHSENFGMVVAEALAHGLPVVTTTGTPWTELAARKCGWQVAPDQGAIREALRQAMASPQKELVSMGRNGRDWVEREYAWQHIAAMMLKTYSWLHDAGQCPDWVHRD